MSQEEETRISNYSGLYRLWVWVLTPSKHCKGSSIRDLYKHLFAHDDRFLLENILHPLCNGFNLLTWQRVAIPLSCCDRQDSFGHIRYFLSQRCLLKWLQNSPVRVGVYGCVVMEGCLWGCFNFISSSSFFGRWIWTNVSKKTLCCFMLHQLKYCILLHCLTYIPVEAHVTLAHQNCFKALAMWSLVNEIWII